MYVFSNPVHWCFDHAPVKMGYLANYCSDFFHYFVETIQDKLGKKR